MGTTDWFGNEENSLRGLAFELKNPLINIARQAELADNESSRIIQQTAERSLMLIDSYLLNAQTEYGQIALDLEPVNIGSVLYDASEQLRLSASQKSVELILDDRVGDPIMTHRLALTSVLSVFGSSLMEVAENGRLILRGFKTRTGKLGVGVFTRAEVSQSDVDKAMKLQGKAYMPFSSVDSSAHVSLAIAGGLCRAVGGEMKVKHMGALSGLATELPISEQLAFI